MSGLDRAERLLWICLLLLVPVSASPLLPFGSGTLVRPLSVVPAALLLAIAGFRFLFLRQRPVLSADGNGWLALFVLYVLVAGLIQISLVPDEPFKGQTPLASFVRALVTLFVGVAFYSVALLNIRTANDVRMTIFWLFIGLSASVALAVVQVIAIVLRGPALRAVQALTDLFAVHYDGLVTRAQGMTFEPSWLAVQIILLMLPALIARIISRQAAPGAPAESRNVYLALGGFAVALTGLLCAGSRLGIVSVVVMLLLSATLALAYGRFHAVVGLVAVLAAGGGGVAALSNLSAGAGAGYVLGPIFYLADFSLLDGAGSPDFAAFLTDALTMGGRAAAGEAAFNLWRDHPLFGVSLGNTYRYFSAYAPDWSFASPIFHFGAQEGVGWLDTNAPEKANAKNFLLRLLSETGLVGFTLFFLFVLKQLFAGPAHDAYYAVFRLATVMALLFSAINQDSFADPAQWIMLVVCATMGRLQGTERKMQLAFASPPAAMPS